MRLNRMSLGYPIHSADTGDYQSDPSEPSLMIDHRDGVGCRIAVQINRLPERIEAWVSSGQAEHCLVVSCGQSFFYEAYRFTEQLYEADLNLGSLGDRIRVELATVTTDLLEFKGGDDHHPSYRGIAFSLDKGDVVAFHGAWTIPVNTDIYYKHISSSIVQIGATDKEDAVTASIDDSGDHIRVLLPKEAHENVRMLVTQSSKFKELVLGSYVLYGIMHGLWQICNEWEDETDSEVRPLWWLCLRKMSEEYVAKEGASKLERRLVPSLAETILGSPLTKIHKVIADEYDD